MTSPPQARTLVSPWCRWCLIIVVILIIIILIWPCWICCWIYPDNCPPCDSTDPVDYFADAQIEFTHDGVLAISEITNNLESGGSPHTRSGFLVQLGSYRSTGTMPHFEKVVFMSGTTGLDTLYAADFTWIDVIGDLPSATTPPIDPSSKEPFMLWPDGRTLCSDAAVQAPCTELDAMIGHAVFPACNDCSDAILVDDVCLRTRAIHAYFDQVTNFVTLWQGSDGIDIRFAPEASTAAGRLDSSYLMRFSSIASVKAYKLESGCSVTEVAIPSGWDRIVFHADLLPGQGAGERMDPPWP